GLAPSVQPARRRSDEFFAIGHAPSRQASEPLRKSSRQRRLANYDRRNDGRVILLDRALEDASVCEIVKYATQMMISAPRTMAIGPSPNPSPPSCGFPSQSATVAPSGLVTT